MKFSELVVLLPCHSLDDFPYHLEGANADGLLAAWSALWHPTLIAGAQKTPVWHRVDSPPMDIAGWLIVVPEVAVGQLPVGYVTHARESGATVVLPARQREEILATIFSTTAESSDPSEAGGAERSPTPAIDAELVADFLALGLCRLLVDLLARQRYYSTSLDEMALGREVVGAARAAIAGDVKAAQTGLTHSFQLLGAGRQYFYPAESYLVDLTLVAPTTLGAGLAAELNQASAVNLLIPAPLLSEIAEHHPVTWQALTAALQRGSVSLVGGEQQEGLLPLLPLEAILANLVDGLATFQRLTGQRPHVFGRRRYGLSPVIPQILDKLGYQGALHVTLDDGRFPLRVQSKVRWQGDDTSAIDSIARLPRDAAEPHTLLDLPRRLGEAMDTDHVATIVMAHWPGLASPWYADLRRIARFTGALGRFVTLEQYFKETFAPGEHARFLADEYRSPYLKQAIAAGQSDPLSQLAHIHRRQAERSALDAVTAMTQIAGNRLAPTADEVTSPPDQSLALSQAVALFAAALPRSAEPAVPSSLVVNPLSFRRSVVIRRPEIAGVADANESQSALVEVPALGFAWVDWKAPAPRRGRREQPIAQGTVLRNEFFQLTIDPTTGGIQRLDDYRHRTNRLSQQLALRTTGDAVLAGRMGQSRDDQAVYSRMQAEAVEITAADTNWGEITSRGQLVDAAGQRLAGFVQRTRVERGSRLAHLAIELEPVEELPADPWQAYFAARFAWDSAAADLWRGVHSGQHPTVAQQIEAPEYVEIDSAICRTVILTGGLPFHRHSGPRILDSLLIVRGETARKFQLAIGVDVPNPAAASAECLTPATELHEIARPPAGERQGWLFHVDARSVLATHWQAVGSESSAGPTGFRVRLLETSGRAVRVTLRNCRPVATARKIDFRGESIGELETDQDRVFCELAGHEWAEIEAFW
jgi:alpha-mannosidase